MDDYFTICQYKTEEPRNIEISAPISLGSVLVWNKHVFPRSKMTVFQTYNKQYGIKIVAVWVEILQLHRYIIMVITWLYLKKEKKNFQSIEKHTENKYACSFLLLRPLWFRFWVLDASVLQMLDLLKAKCSVWFAVCCIAHICTTDMTSLISFFLILFHYWAAFVVYQQNRVNNTTSDFLANIFFC